MFSRFFINRPRFAVVISLVLALAGIISFRSIPIEEYPNITPPQIYIFCSYTGAGSEVIRDTVASPLEDELNGVDDIMYFNSNCDNNGSYFCIVTFEAGTDEDMAQVKIQNAVKRAEARLPLEVTRRGINILKRSNDILCMYAFTTDGSNLSKKDLSNYLAKSVKDTVQRVEGISSVDVMGGEAYSMRIWLDPLRMGSLGISPTDVSAAIQAQNVQIVSGTIGSEGGNDLMQMKVDTVGRLSSTEQFENIVIRTGSDNSVVLLKDIATVELGAEAYSTFGEYNGEEAVMLVLYRDASSNALQVMDDAAACLANIKTRLPAGVDFSLGYDPTEFIRVSMKEIISTLVFAVLLVVVITYLFLQNIRATLVPIIAIPVALLATFPVMAALGFSINTLTMFGLILVIGSLVDDAIVVSEGTVSLMEREGLSPREAALKCMSQVTGAVIATTLVTLACYLPLAYYGGIVGTIYKQFAVTMCVSLCFSTLVALTLSPAMCAIILKKPTGKVPALLRPVEGAISSSRKAYLWFVKGLVRRGLITLLLLAGVCAGIYVSVNGFSLGGRPLIQSFKSAFLTQEDKGVILCNVELPPGSSLNRTTEALQAFRDRVLEAFPEAIDKTMNITGFGFLSGAGEHSGMLIVSLKHWDERKDPSLSAQAMRQKIQGIAMEQADANIVCFTPPAIQGLGATGGISGYLCGDGVSVEELGAKVQEFCRTLTADPDCMYAMTTFTANSPQVFLDIDRQKALQLGLTMSDISFALQSGLGSYYINDFTYKTESFYVQMQNDRSLRSDVEDLMNLQIVSSKTGELVPLSSVATFRYTTGSRSLQRFNKTTAAQLQIQAMPGVPSVALMDKIEKMDLGKQFRVEWTDLSYHEKKNQGKIVSLFAMAILFAYLFLVAQYESWTIPVPVMLTVATATLGAIIGSRIAGMDMNIYVQLGLVMLIGLTAKNAILMVEFSKQERDRGVPIADAAMRGAELRYRAVLMTAWSFIFGVFPLVVASGAGAGSRRAIGVPTFSGMIVATFVGIILTPALYAVFQRFREYIKHKAHVKTAAEKYLEEHGGASNSGKAVLPLVLAICAAGASTLLTGCLAVRNAREAQKDASMLPGERVVSVEEAGLSLDKPVPLAELEAVALRCNPSVLQADQNVILAQIAVRDVNSSLIPTLDATAGYTMKTSNTDPAADTDWGLDGSWNGNLSLNWLVYDFGRTKASARKAVQGLIAADSNARAVRDSVVYGVRNAFISVLRTRALYEVAKESSAAYRTHYEQMKSRHEVGAVNSYAVTKASVDASNAELSSVSASNAVLTASASLELALGVYGIGGEIPLGSYEFDDYARFSAEELMSLARTNSPALTSLRANAEGARYAIDKAVADLYPSLGVGIQLVGAGDGDILWNLTGAASLSQSIFAAGRNRRAIDSAVAQFRIARSKLAAEELSVYNQLKVAVLDSGRARQQLAVAAETQKMAKENFDIVDERYKVGRASELERTDAQVALSSAKASAISALYDYLSAQVLISRIIGL